MHARRIIINGKEVKPIFEAGMAVEITNAEIVSAVANEGGVGIIGGSGMHPPRLKAVLEKARSMTSGAIGVNLMTPLEEFKELVQVAIDGGADMLAIAAAIPSRTLIKEIKDKIATFLLISDPKHIAAPLKMGMAGEILESGLAGGHLGTGEGGENISLYDILPQAAENLRELRQEINPNFILAAAGGIFYPSDIAWALQYADAVQMGTRFAVSKESAASDIWKNLMVDSTAEDLAIIESPVGLPLRAVKTPFVVKLLAGEIPPLTQEFKDDHCRHCLSEEVCKRNYCIFLRLLMAKKGDLEEGLFTIGARVGEVKDIPTVHEVFRRIEQKIQL